VLLEEAGLLNARAAYGKIQALRDEAALPLAGVA
jgi:hypothetical protein